MQGFILGVSLAALVLSLPVNAGNENRTAETGSIFAQINDLTISKAEFDAIFRSAVSYKYYHGKVPAEELEKFRKQVAEDIVTQQLVYNEALQIGLKPDRDQIDQGIEAFDLKNADNRDWKSQREQVIPQMVKRLERQDLVTRMEARVRDIPSPDPKAVKQYYLDRPEKFTEPERRRAAVILFKVPPYAMEDEWLATQAELGEIKLRIESGEDFAELAREYSEHPSAANGGDLGYMHQGVLEPEVQQKINALEPGQLSDTIRVLEGVTLFQLMAVAPAQLKPYSEVKERAADLLYRELQDLAWDSYVSSLRSSATIRVYE